MLTGPGLAVLIAVASQAPGATAAASRAEALASEAVALAASDPAGARDRARRALGLTADFVPTVYVRAGRKGEVVEDAYQSARAAYHRHRAGLYGAMGAVLARGGEPLAASRYLRRALLLDPTPVRARSLAAALNQLGRGREALDAVLHAIKDLAPLDPASVEVVARAADAAGLPSAQAELDRARLRLAFADKVVLRPGPFELPPDARLSTAPTARLEPAALTLIYASEASCRSCSADLDELGRSVPKDVRVLLLPPGDDQDQTLRQVNALYRRGWPLLLGRDLAERLSVRPRSLLLVARGGWTVAVIEPPFESELATAIGVLQMADVPEPVPRAAWNRRPVDRTPAAPAPALLPEGLAPGEDEPFPPEFEAAVAAFRSGQKARALALFEALEAKGDGWLLPPEARLDRALCLAGTGRRDAARRLLLRTGDSRFEDAIDRLLEVVAAGR